MKRITIILLLIGLLLFTGCGASEKKTDQAAQSSTVSEYSPTQERLITEIGKDQDNVWKATIKKIVRNYDPEKRSGEIIFYGASNFAQWTTMEQDLSQYHVQNHAFGGSTDADLRFWAKYLLYPYDPEIIFFQTGSNDYVESTAQTDEEKVAEAMSFKKEMFAEIHDNLPDAQLIVMSGILLPGREEYVDMTLEINDLLKEYCEQTPYMTFVDAEALTYDRSSHAFVENASALFQEDQIHLTGESRLVWAENWIVPAIQAASDR